MSATGTSLEEAEFEPEEAESKGTDKKPEMMDTPPVEAGVGVG